LAKVKSIAVGTNDKRQYYHSILLLLSLLSCLKLFDNSDNDIISNRMIDSFIQLIGDTSFVMQSAVLSLM
jgi:hypothetical protein